MICIQNDEYIWLDDCIWGQLDIKWGYVHPSQASVFNLSRKVAKQPACSRLVPFIRRRCHIEDSIYNFIAASIIWKGRIIFIGPAALPWPWYIISSSDHRHSPKYHCHFSYAFRKRQECHHPSHPHGNTAEERPQGALL